MAQPFPSHQLLIGSLAVEVTVKPIKHLHLSVLPPHGAVRISAPERMSEAQVRAYTIGKLGWIRSQQSRFARQERESPREVIERESHHVWGQRLLLHIQEVDTPPRVELHPKQLTLFIRPGTTSDKRQSILATWYRDQLRAAAEPLIQKWEQALGVEMNRLFVQSMTRKWGSCNPASRNIRLNTQLAQKPKSCLDYVLLHELCHLRVPGNGEAFVELLHLHMSDWEERKQHLNRLPILST
ncbi:MAG: M48 family metallopeptidase [Cyanobacteriota bacterium]